MGKHGKDNLNESGRMLMEIYSNHDLIVTNTLFKHKFSHRPLGQLLPENILPKMELRQETRLDQIDLIPRRSLLQAYSPCR